MKNFVLVVLLFSLLHLGYSLSCYKCNGCEITNSVLKETCRNVDPETQNSFCLTQKVHITGSPPMTLKKCVVESKNKDYECVALPDSETLSCQVCQTDFCNGVSKVLASFGFSASLFLLVFVPKLWYC